MRLFLFFLLVSITVAARPIIRPVKHSGSSKFLPFKHHLFKREATEKLPQLIGGGKRGKVSRPTRG